MSNGNSLNISNIKKMFLYLMVMGNVNSWIRKKGFFYVKRYPFWYLVLENIRKYFLIILKLCRLNENRSLSSVYYQSS